MILREGDEVPPALAGIKIADGWQSEIVSGRATAATFRKLAKLAVPPAEWQALVYTRWKEAHSGDADALAWITPLLIDRPPLADADIEAVQLPDMGTFEDAQEGRRRIAEAIASGRLRRESARLYMEIVRDAERNIAARNGVPMPSDLAGYTPVYFSPDMSDADAALAVRNARANDDALAEKTS